ncbi:DUF3927 family protein [Aeromonas bestiarum]|uniref:DUF3927 family protein n=1 Tax=Aeromonas bestiarum TaxID=105751 RepID=A0AAW7I3T0_9GAMM|nr:DUF3927 family protein [Aeromonas bestiarum]MDM5141560.1 DUF3927 family protein [Aeromonas bestiarum]
MPNPRWLLVGAFLLLSVGVDFSSRILSMAADGLLVGAAIAIAWPLLKLKPKK